MSTINFPNYIGSYRTDLINVINIDSNILEIGASYNPLLSHNRSNIYNIDVMTKNELIIKNEKEFIIFDKNNIPETDFLLTTENDFDFYKCVGNSIKFDYIISSHNFEHFPNFIKSLNSLEKILNDSCQIIAFIPDCRFEFDTYRNLTKVSKLIADFYNDKRKPSLEEIIENRLLFCNTSTINLWHNYNLYNNLSYLEANYKINCDETECITNQILNNSKETIENIYNSYLKLDYIDAHVNCFTPDSFKRIIDILLELNYINLKISMIYQTEQNSHEFLVILTKNK